MDRKERLGRLAFPLALALLLGLAPALSLAQPRGGPPGPPDPERMLDRMTERLDLTDQQRQDLDAVFTNHRKTMRPTHEAMRTARESLDSQIHAEDFDEGAIRKAAAVMAVLEADQAVGRARLFQEIRGILTPEQVEKFEQLREERQEKRGSGRRGEFPGPGLGSRRGSF